MRIFSSRTRKQDLPQEVGLLCLTEVADTHMGQHLLLQDFLGVLDPPLLGHAWFGSTGSDEVQSYVLLLDDKGLVQGRLHLGTQPQYQ